MIAAALSVFWTLSLSVSLYFAAMNADYSYLADYTLSFEHGEQRLEIGPVNSGIAAIYFVNKDGARVNPPRGYTLTSKSSGPISPFGSPGMFYITWFEDYDLRYNGDLIYSVNNPRTQIVSRWERMDK